eukprot:3867006-Amphidinium_carterae.2
MVLGRAARVLEFRRVGVSCLDQAWSVASIHKRRSTAKSDASSTGGGLCASSGVRDSSLLSKIIQPSPLATKALLPLMSRRPPKKANLSGASADAIERWRSSSHVFPVEHVEKPAMIFDGSELRVLSVSERERLLGFDVKLSITHGQHYAFVGTCYVSNFSPSVWSWLFAELLHGLGLLACRPDPCWGLQIGTLCSRYIVAHGRKIRNSRRGKGHSRE